MNYEEIQIKMGLRVDALSQGIQRAKADMAALGEHVKSTFGGKGKDGPGAGLVRLFDELTDRAPLLGNALKFAFNPLTIGLGAAFAGFAYAKGQLAEWNKILDESGDKAKKPAGLTKDMMLKTGVDIAKSRDTFKDWMEAHQRGPIGSKDRQEMQERIDRAAEEAGGDKVKFGKSKLAILEDERKKAVEQDEAATARAQSAQSAIEDPTPINLKKEHEATLKTLEEEAETAKQKAEEKDANIRRLEAMKERPFEVAREMYAEGGKMFDNDPLNPRKADINTALSVGIWDLIPNLGAAGEGPFKEALTEAIEKEKQDLEVLESRRRSFVKGKEKLYGKLAEDNSAANQRQDDLKKAQAEADEAQQRRLEIDKTISETQRQLKQDEREKAFAAAKAERDIALQEKKIKNERDAKYMPTVDELAGMGAWDPILQQKYGMRGMFDQMALNNGTAFVSKYAKDAQELQLLEQDAKMALAVEGKDSTRYQQDMDRINELRQKLVDAGIQPEPTGEQALKNKLATFLENAEKQGILVQPSNAE